MQRTANDGSAHYYVKESIGLACGMLITALHMVGLATLTYTPSNGSFLGPLLERPTNERPYMILPIGYPHEAYQPPNITRKDLSDVLVKL